MGISWGMRTDLNVRAPYLCKSDRERFILKNSIATGYKLTGCMNLTSSGFINYFIFGGFCVYSDRQEKAGAETGFFTLKLIEGFRNNTFRAFRGRYAEG
jgi:hypothetical protein